MESDPVVKGLQKNCFPRSRAFVVGVRNPQRDEDDPQAGAHFPQEIRTVCEDDPPAGFDPTL